MLRSLVCGLAATFLFALAAPAAHAQIEVMSDGRVLMIDEPAWNGEEKGAVYVRRTEEVSGSYNFTLHARRDDNAYANRGIYGNGIGGGFAEGLYGLGLNGSDLSQGVLALGDSDVPGATNVGVYGYGVSDGVDQITYGVYGHAHRNSASSGGVRYGGYFTTTGSGEKWAGYFEGRVHVAGDLHYTGTLSQVSDGRLKRDVRDVSGALGKLKGLKPRSYEYRRGEHPRKNLAKGRRYGLVAQEVEAVLPELVTELDHVTPQEFDEEGLPIEGTGGKRESWKAVSYTELIPLLLAGLQEQQATIEALEKRLEALEQRRGGN